MLNRKIIKKEISLLHFLLMTTSKLLIGIGIGIMITTYFWFAQPYWFLLILTGAVILALTLYNLMRAEGTEEITLEKELKK